MLSVKPYCRACSQSFTRFVTVRASWNLVTASWKRSCTADACQTAHTTSAAATYPLFIVYDSQTRCKSFQPLACRTWGCYVTGC